MPPPYQHVRLDAAETLAVSSAYGRSRFSQVVWHEMFHAFRKPGVPNAALVVLICTRDACGGRDMVCTQSLAAATELLMSILQTLPNPLYMHEG